MKYIYLSAFFLVFCFTACQKNADFIDTVTENPSTSPISTIDFAWWVIVEEEESLYKWDDIHRTQIQNATVKLIFSGDILWESNTDHTGRVTFPEQPVPAEDAYFLFEAPGYYPLVVQIEGESIPLWRVNMIRNTFPNINGEAIKDAESYITLTGKLQNPSTTREAWFYILNADGELVGNSTVGPETPQFYMTTLPNEELFLHYNVECGDNGVIALGSYSESTDIGNLVDQSFDFSFDRDQFLLRNVADCSSGTKLFGYDLFYNVDNLTFQAGGNSGFHLLGCEQMERPVLVSVATQDPRKYVEVNITHTPGQRFEIPDQEACEDDDTFLKYTIGNGTEAGGEVFTFANILPDGQMVLKQAEISLNDYNRFSMVFDGATLGSHQSNLNLVVRQYSASGSWSNVNGLGAYQLNSTITMNDGTFIEGTFSGEVLDTEEISLGNIEGTFRARIQ